MLCFLHRRQILSHLSHQGSPLNAVFLMNRSLHHVGLFIHNSTTLMTHIQFVDNDDVQIWIHALASIKNFQFRRKKT